MLLGDSQYFFNERYLHNIWFQYMLPYMCIHYVISIYILIVFIINHSLPMFIDAVIFSYLHVILEFPASSANDLYQLVNRYKNLVDFTRRIYTEFYENEF